MVVMMCLAVVAVSGYSNPCNQQKGTYKATFSPLPVSADMSITPFFSPSGSTPTLTKIVEDATDVRSAPVPYPAALCFPSSSPSLSISSCSAADGYDCDAQLEVLDLVW